MTIRDVLRAILAALLLFEALTTALWITGLIASLPGRDPWTLAVIALRAAVGALELTGGLLLRGNRASGPVLARWALVASAVLTTFEIGWRLSPSNMDPTFRWWFVGAYWIYVSSAAAWI